MSIKTRRFGDSWPQLLIIFLLTVAVNGLDPTRKLDEATGEVKCGACPVSPPPPVLSPPPPSPPPPPPPSPKKPPSTSPYCPPPPSSYIYITGPPGDLYPIVANGHAQRSGYVGFIPALLCSALLVLFVASLV